METGLYLDDEDNSIVIADVSDEEVLIRISFDGIFKNFPSESKVLLASAVQHKLQDIIDDIAQETIRQIAARSDVIPNPHKNWPGDSYDHVDRLEQQNRDSY